MVRPKSLAALAACAAILVTPRQLGAEPSAWALDPARTHINFTIDAVGFPSTKGEFHDFVGRLSVDFARPERSRVAFTVKSQSVDVGSPSFNGTLRGAAFLDSTRFPDIRFESTQVEKRDDSHVVLSGDLALLGVTKPLAVEVEVKRDGGDRRLAFNARAHIDRLAWGMNSGYPVISRDVDLLVTSEAAAK